MKTIVAATLFGLLTGCANFDAERFNNALAYQYQVEQNRAANYNAISAENAARHQQQLAVMAQQYPARPAMTAAGMLTGQRAEGALRYCAYSNGVVSTISVTSFCPQTN